LLVVAVLVSGMVPVLSGTSWACTCAPFPDKPYRVAAHEADMIYVGRVLDNGTREGSEGNVTADTIYEVEVRRELKGDASGPSGSGRIRQVRSSQVCGKDLDRGRVLVMDDSADLCGYTTQAHVEARADTVYDELRRMGGYRPSTHVVRRGEWLYKIARDRLEFDPGTTSLPPCSVRDDCDDDAVRRAARRIYDENRARIGPDPDRLQPGTRLRIPRLR
jgi:hypothetical protein